MARVRPVENALFVAEMSGEGAGSHPTRCLVGTLEPGEGLVPLQSGPSLAPPDAPSPAVAADDQGVLRELLDEVTQGTSPAREEQVEGRRLRLWRVEKEAWRSRVESALSEMPVRPLAALPAAPSLAAIYPLSESGLRLRPVHRGLKGLATFHPERFLAVLKDYARVYELDGGLDSLSAINGARERLANLSSGNHGFLLVLPGGEGRLLRYRQDLDLLHLKAAPRNPTLRSLDLALLQAVVLRTVLGLQAPDAEEHPNIVSETSLQRLVERVRGGELQAGFALNPPPTWEIRAVMEAAQVMPPRTLKLEPVAPSDLLGAAMHA